MVSVGQLLGRCDSWGAWAAGSQLQRCYDEMYAAWWKASITANPII